MINSVICGDALETLRTMPDEFVDCVITSPPYYQLRDYGYGGQWGLEKTHTEYLDKMISMMAELKRLLKPAGTMWINLGDTYNTSKGGTWNQDKYPKDCNAIARIKANGESSYPRKSQLLIPHRFAIRCIDELGLILRNDIIWAKPIAMPESITDRFSKRHEFMFFFVKQEKYHFDLDAIRESHSLGTLNRNKYPKREYGESFAKITAWKPGDFAHKNGKNPGDVSDFWDITTRPSGKKHFATFSAHLIDKPILAGCPEGGIILDPFCGTGTTLVRAHQLGRQFIGIDGSSEYCSLATRYVHEQVRQMRIFQNEAADAAR